MMMGMKMAKATKEDEKGAVVIRATATVKRSSFAPTSPSHRNCRPLGATRKPRRQQKRRKVEKKKVEKKKVEKQKAREKRK
jgi:hypothetical protein